MRDHLNEHVPVIYEVIEKEMSHKLQNSFKLLEDVKPIIRKLLHDFRTKWQKVKRTEQTFFEKFRQWLSVLVYFNKSEVAEEDIEMPKKGI